MTRLDMVRVAVEELGQEASHEQVDAFVRQRFAMCHQPGQFSADCRPFRM